MDSFIIYWIKVNCHLFVLMLKVSQICLARAIQASLSFYTSSWILERFLILWRKMSQTHRDFLCLLVFACRQWGLCWDCLGLCSPGLILVMRSPHRNSPFTVSVVAGPALVVLRIVRHISATTNHQGTLKCQDVSLTCPGEDKASLGWHSEVLGGKRGRAHEQAWTWDSAFLRLRMGCLGF